MSEETVASPPEHHTSETRGANDKDGAPRFALFLCDCADPQQLARTLARIPPSLQGAIDEIVVMLDRPSRREAWTAENDFPDSAIPLVFHVPPSRASFGAIRKSAFEYGLRRGFDSLIVMRGDGTDPPESLPAMLERARSDAGALVLAQASSAEIPRKARFSRGLSNFVQNRILGMRLGDYHPSFRVYPSAALRRIPFQLNSDDRRFDFEIVVQFRALRAPIRELPLPARSTDGPGATPRPGTQRRAWQTALEYRLHQAHVTRDGRYLVDHDVHYTLKHSETSSHFQVAHAIAPGSEVLDLGCSTGLLARPLLEKNVRVTGVDAGEGLHLAEELAEYHRHDLERPLDLPLSRKFDYVVCADVIEHLRNRAQLLRSARRFLKPEGKLIISTPNVALWFYRLSLLVGRFEYGPRGVLDETHVHLYTKSTFRREIENAGFRPLQMRVTALPFEVVFESTGRSRLIRTLASSYHWLARAWPSMFAYQFVLEAQITTLDEEGAIPLQRADVVPALDRPEGGDAGAS